MGPSDVLIAVPTRGAVRNETISRLESVREREGIDPILFCSGRLSSHETRNELARGFLRSDKQVIVMCDDDIIPPTNILDLIDSLDEFGIVAAAAPCFQPKVSVVPLLMAYDHVPEQNTYRHLEGVWQRTGVVECDAVGFGCVAIHRRVFEAMTFPYFRMEFNDAGSITDDMTFCRDARELGFRVAMNFDLQCEHFSTVQLFELAKGIFALVSDVKTGSNEQAKLLNERSGITVGMMLEGRPVMQNPADIESWTRFFADETPRTIIELGTGTGGMSVFLADNAERFTTFDCVAPSNETPGFIKTDIYNDAVVMETIAEAERPLLLFCDGGDKPEEMRRFAHLLAPGDVLAVHDFGREVFETDVPGFLEPVEVEVEGSLTRFFRRGVGLAEVMPERELRLVGDPERLCEFCSEPSIGQLTYDSDTGRRKAKVCREHAKQPSDLVHAD